MKNNIRRFFPGDLCSASFIRGNYYHKALKNKLTRVVVYPKDVSRITGKSERYGRKLLRTIKEVNEKEAHQFVSLEEFSDYTGLPVALIKEHLID